MFPEKFTSSSKYNIFSPSNGLLFCFVLFCNSLKEDIYEYCDFLIPVTCNFQQFVSIMNIMNNVPIWTIIYVTLYLSLSFHLLFMSSSVLYLVFWRRWQNIHLFSMYSWALDYNKTLSILVHKLPLSTMGKILLDGSLKEKCHSKDREFNFLLKLETVFEKIQKVSKVKFWRKSLCMCLNGLQHHHTSNVLSLHSVCGWRCD